MKTYLRISFGLAVPALRILTSLGRSILIIRSIKIIWGSSTTKKSSNTTKTNFVNLTSRTASLKMSTTMNSTRKWVLTCWDYCQVLLLIITRIWYKMAQTECYWTILHLSVIAHMPWTSNNNLTEPTNIQESAKAVSTILTLMATSKIKLRNLVGDR